MCVSRIQVGRCAVHVKAPREVWRARLQKNYIFNHQKAPNPFQTLREVMKCKTHIAQSPMSICVRDPYMLQAGQYPTDCIDLQGDS